MASMNKRRNVLGLFVDGLDIKLAHLSIKGKRVTVNQLRSATLVSRVEERQAVEAGMASLTEGSLDGFPAPPMAPTELGAPRSGEDNNAVVLGLLSEYPVRKYSVTYSISEPSIYYHTLESDFGLKGKKLKERILNELRNVRPFQPALDAVDSVSTDEGNLLCVVREDGLSLINIFENVKGYIGNRIPNIPAIDTTDISLMNMVRLNYDLQPHEVSVVIYIGAEFTRLIFMRGNQLFQFAPILGEGYDSPNLHNTVYSRLLLEQDNLGIPRLSRIILTGECRRVAFKEFLIQQLPDHEIDYLLAPNLDSSPLPAEQQEAISEFAVPIGAAWRVLESSNPRLYRINLLPEAVREGQRVFKLNWHGYLLLVVLFASAFLFTRSITSKLRELKDQEGLLGIKQAQVAENQVLSDSIEAVKGQRARFQTSLALYDSLVPGTDRWSTTLTQLSHATEDLNSIWLTDLVSGTDGGVTMNGFTLYRTRIPRLSAQFDQSVLKEVNVEEIREQTVYRYKLDVPSTVMAEQPK
jgi:hypothetical protein